MVRIPMTNRLLALTAAALLAATLGGCSSLRNTFGVERGGPDEFTVVRHAPLTLPPDYNLRPPQPGVPRPQEGTAQSQARSAVLGSPKPTTSMRSPPLPRKATPSTQTSRTLDRPALDTSATRCW